MKILVANEDWDAHDYAMARWLQSLPAWAEITKSHATIINVNRSRPSRTTINRIRL